MSANLENSVVATGLEKVSFHSNPKERQCQRGQLKKNSEFPISTLDEERFPSVTGDETRVPLLNLRGIPSSLSQLERNPEIPASTREEYQVLWPN